MIFLFPRWDIDMLIPWRVYFFQGYFTKNPRIQVTGPKFWAGCDLSTYVFCWSIWDMGVSENGGPQKRMIYNGKPYKNGWFGGTPIFGNIHMISFCTASFSKNIISYDFVGNVLFLLIRGPALNFSVPGNDVGGSVSSKYLLGQLVGSPQLLRESLTWGVVIEDARR